MQICFFIAKKILIQNAIILSFLRSIILREEWEDYKKEGGGDQANQDKD